MSLFDDIMIMTDCAQPAWSRCPRLSLALPTFRILMLLTS